METVKRMDGRLPLYVFETLRLPSGYVQDERLFTGCDVDRH